MSLRRLFRYQRCAAAGCASFFVLVLLTSFPAAAEDTYLQELTLRAKRENLASERYWRILLHYTGSGESLHSLVDDPRYFLSPSGKTDPEAELAADLAAFLSPAVEGAEHPRVRFPARFEWLKERLGIDGNRLPPADSRQLDKFLEGVAPRRAVLVFPAAHGNGPASMFGHTLIRIDGPEESGLVSHAVNYAAQADDTNGFLYAFKGIFGFYPGYFSILPYYEKVKEYGEMERRDVWEYRLNLSPREVRRMTLHVWELRDIASDYFFFDENCSFDLLYLLEAARPEVDLTERFLRRKFAFWVVPVDTVRAVQESGMVEEKVYRPSEAAVLQTAGSGLAEETLKAAGAMASGTLDPELFAAGDRPRRETVLGLELAAKLARYRFVGGEISKEAYLAAFMPALKTRSRLGLLDDPPQVPRPEPPEVGHPAGKGSVTAGVKDGRSFAEIRWRPAFHDLTDPDEGFVFGSQIVFLEGAARVTDRERVEIQEINLIDIVSLAPRERFFSPISWKVTTGLYRRYLDAGDDHLVYAVHPGGGGAWHLFSGIAWSMLETDIAVGPALDSGVSAGLGITAGWVGNPLPRWRLLLSLQAFGYAVSNTGEEYSGKVVSSFDIGSGYSLKATAAAVRSFGRTRTETSLGVARYF